MNDIIEQYLCNVKDEYLKFLNDIDLEQINNAVKIIEKCKQAHGRVHITGIGKPSHIAGYIASLMSSTGTPSYKLDATESLHGSAGQVNANDVVIAISNSGQTKELNNALVYIKKIGAKVIGVSGKIDSWLFENSDAFLYAGVSKEGDSMNKPPRLSILVEMTILQVLSVALQEKSNITLEQYLLWHPGGSLGETTRLQLGEKVCK